MESKAICWEMNIRCLRDLHSACHLQRRAGGRCWALGGRSRSAGAIGYIEWCLPQLRSYQCCMSLPKAWPQRALYGSTGVALPWGRGTWFSIHPSTSALWVQPDQGMQSQPCGSGSPGSGPGLASWRSPEMSWCQGWPCLHLGWWRSEQSLSTVRSSSAVCSRSLWGEVNAPPAGLKLMDWQCSSCWLVQLRDKWASGCTGNVCCQTQWEKFLLAWQP